MKRRILSKVWSVKFLQIINFRSSSIKKWLLNILSCKRFIPASELGLHVGKTSEDMFQRGVVKTSSNLVLRPYHFPRSSLYLSLSLSLLVVLNRGTGFRTWNVVYVKERERVWNVERGLRKDLYKEERALKEACS